MVKTTHVIDEVYLKRYVTDGDTYWLLMICHFICVLHINSGSIIASHIDFFDGIGYSDTNFVSFDDDIDYYLQYCK